MNNGKFKKAAPIILEELSYGATNREAMREAGISEDTFYRWLKEDSEFSEAVQKAQDEGRKRAVNDVEAALLKTAKGFDIEEVRTEYVSKVNPVTGKYEPVINKQTRVTKHISPNVEAIKYYLSNRAPEQWQNKVEQTNLGKIDNEVVVRYVGKEGEEIFPSSETEVLDAEK